MAWLCDVDALPSSAPSSPLTSEIACVWLVAALASGAPVTLLDQPCAALDKASERVFWGLLAEVLPAQPQRVWVLADYGVAAGAPAGQVWGLPTDPCHGLINRTPVA